VLQLLRFGEDRLVGRHVRLFIDLEQDGDLAFVFRHRGWRNLMAGREAVVSSSPRDECLANTRKGKQVLSARHGRIRAAP
jgi:topoisomerase-4 subunit A